MKGLVLFFSGTGNTASIAQGFCHEFRKYGHEMDSRSIEELGKEQLNYDFLLIGFPKYYGYGPLFFIEKIRAWVDSADRSIPTILFCTDASNTLTPFQELVNILEEKNHAVLMTRTFKMPTNFYLRPEKKMADSSESEERIEIAHLQVQETVKDFHDNKFSKDQADPDKTEDSRNTAKKFTGLHQDKIKLFSTDKDCILCEICLKSCPVQNIKMNQSKISFGDDCVMCLRCMNRCPRNAILYDNHRPHQYRIRAT